MRFSNDVCVSYMLVLHIFNSTVTLLQSKAQPRNSFTSHVKILHVPEVHHLHLNLVLFLLFILSLCVRQDHDTTFSLSTKPLMKICVSLMNLHFYSIHRIWPVWFSARQYNIDQFGF